MSGNVKLAYTISKNAAQLVRSGAAVLESGGVRSLDGRIVELARPAAINLATKTVGSPISMVSSLANNVQSGFIQYGVNQANKKLDISLEKMSQIEKAVNGLLASAALGWVNMALGVANCGISIAGFYMTMNKLQGISQQIQSLHSLVEANIKKDNIIKCRKFINTISSNMNHMLQSDFRMDQTTSMFIENHLGEVEAYLAVNIQNDPSIEIDGMTRSNLIYPLAVLYAQEIKLYFARYFYEKGKFPMQYTTWISNTINEIDRDQFKKSFKQALIMECPDASTQQKIIAYSGAVCAIQEQRGLLEYEKQMVPLLTENEYLNLDTYLTRQLNNGRIKTTKDKVCIEIG